MLTRAQAEAMASDGAAALRRGDLATARAKLWPLKDTDSSVAPPWLLIAQVAQACGDEAEAEAALTALLRVEPRNLAALLLLAAAKARGGALSHRAERRDPAWRDRRSGAGSAAAGG